MGALTEKQLRFVEEYVIDFNAARAARDAGYAKNSAKVQASQLLDNELIQQEIKKRTEARAEKSEIKALDVLADLVKIAKTDVTQAFGPVGIKRFEDIPEDVRFAIQSVRFDQDGIPVDIKFNPKLKALELIGKHLGMFVEKHEVEVGETLESLLNELSK